jgi:hypothetical protein
MQYQKKHSMGQVQIACERNHKRLSADSVYHRSGVSPAPESDKQQLEAIQSRLAERRLLPAHLYVDQGYMSAANLAKSLTRGIDLRGRLLQDTSGKVEGFRLQDFQVDIANRTEICPGQTQPTKMVAF